MIFEHKSVLLMETVDSLNVKPDGIYVDGTLGGGGHAYEVSRRLGEKGRLIGIDQDADAIAAATERLLPFKDKVTIVRSNYKNIREVLFNLGIEKVDGIYLDLGVSSYQLDTASRGFTYREDAPLDMRMDVTQPLTAEQILAEYSFADLVRIFRTYGEERFSKQIAREIVRRREIEPLTTSGQLNRLVDEVVPQAHRPAGNPAKRVFQALRIEVNGELDKLAGTLPQIANHLAVGGRLVVESYHSLEDKTVKTFMNQGLKADVPADMPVIPPDMMPFFKELTRGAIKAAEEEIAMNPRSASVRLRAVELTRPIPERWRKRFDQGNDYASMKRQGRRG